MSSKIDPIKLFESVISSDPENYLRGHESVYQVTESEVREFASRIAAPVVERQPNAWATLQSGWKDEDRTVITDPVEAEEYNRVCYDLTPLFTAPPELAELQATIATLKSLLGHARGMVNGASDEWHNSVEKVLGHE